MKWLLPFLAFLLIGCTATAVEKPLTLAEVHAALDISNATVYTAETDPNHLLGRPHGYIEKSQFPEGTVEVFADEAAAQRRKAYIDQIAKAAAPFVEYSVVHNNVLLRVNKEQTPERFEQLKAALERL